MCVCVCGVFVFDTTPSFPPTIRSCLPLNPPRIFCFDHCPFGVCPLAPPIQAYVPNMAERKQAPLRAGGLVCLGECDQLSANDVGILPRAPQNIAYVDHTCTNSIIRAPLCAPAACSLLTGHGRAQRRTQHEEFVVGLTLQVPRLRAQPLLLL